MSRQFDQYMEGRFEIYGQEYEIVEPSNNEELLDAFRVRDVLQNAINAIPNEDEESAENLITLLQEQDDAIEAYAESLGTYDNSTLIANINYYGKQMGLRIGNIERFLGLSLGYISRTTKESGKKRMSIDVVWRLSRLFNVSLDDLIRRDMSKTGGDGNMLMEFINRLRDDTRHGTLTWKLDYSEEEEYSERYVMTGMVRKKEELEDDGEVFWKIGRIAFSEGFSGSQSLVIVPYMGATEERSHYRMYDYFLTWNSDEGWKSELIFSTAWEEQPIMEDQSNALYEDIRKSTTEIRMKPGVRSVVSHYLQKGANADD